MFKFISMFFLLFSFLFLFSCNNEENNESKNSNVSKGFENKIQNFSMNFEFSTKKLVNFDGDDDSEEAIPEEPTEPSDYEDETINLIV